MNFYKLEMLYGFIKHKDRYGYFRYNEIPTKQFKIILALTQNNSIAMKYSQPILKKIVSQKYPEIIRDDMFVKVAMDKKSNNWKYK